MFGTVDIKTRPIKLAYLVDPDNKKQVREAMQISTSLWGGDYFPIITLHKRMPKTWREKPLKAPKAKDVILGYIDAFDPDILVQFSKNVPSYVSDLGIEVIKPEEIWSVLDEGRHLSPQYGLGVFEIYNDIFEECFKFKRKYPIKVIAPEIPKKFPFFWVSWFGEYPLKILPILKKNYFEPLEVKTPKIDLGDIKDLLSRDTIFPRRATHHKINGYGRRTARGGYVYFMDADKAEDIIDFWNLRAVGKAVIPLPKQFKDDQNLKEIIIDFLKANRIPWPHNPQVFDHASIIVSRNSSMNELQDYVKTLDFGQSSTDNEPYFLLQHWYPRIWDEWARDKDWVAPHDIYGEEEESIEIQETKDFNLEFKTLLPKFAQKYGYHGNPRCANEVGFRFYGEDEYIAEAFPKSSGDNFIRAISSIGSFRDWRVGRNGLVKLVKDNWNERRSIPLAEDVFFAWLKDLGWQAELSSAGLLAKQIHKKLDGYDSILSNEQLLGLLEHMNGGTVQKNGTPAFKNNVTDGRELPIGEVKSRLVKDGRNNLYELLLKKEVFKMGLKVQCPQCLRRSWFSLESIRDNFTCLLCLNAFPAVGNVDSSAWCYKTAGAFSVPRYADGAYAVLLTADFLNDRKMHRMRITPALSFVAKMENNKKTLEADLAAFWQESIYGEQKEGILFCECKSYNTFEQKDFERMEYIAKTFRGAVIVFSTLRKTLTKKEIAGIKKVTKAGRKYWKTDRPINPVLILTGTELFARFGIPSCWEDKWKKKFGRVTGLIEACDATQQIYLGLPSWHEEWRKKWEKKRTKSNPNP
jgi:hypothetical protein